MDKTAMIAIATLVATTGLMIMGSDSKASGDDTRPIAVGGSRATFEAMLARVPMSEDWRNALRLVAYGESRFSLGAANLTPSEAKAARVAFDRNREHLQCGHPEADYTWGSGGYFGLLPANGLMQFDGGRRCAPPREAVRESPVLSFAMGVGFASGLSSWPGFLRDPAVITLRYGWGWPAKMGNDPEYREMKRVRYLKHVKALGLPASFLETRLGRLRVSADEAVEFITAGGPLPE